MATGNSTIVSTDVSIAGNICYDTSLNKAAGFTSYPTTIMLTGTMGYNVYGNAVTYNLAGQNAYIELTGAIPGTTAYSIYQSYVFIYASGSGQTGYLIPAVAGPNNSSNSVIAISPTNVNNYSTVSFQLAQSIADTNPTFVVQITAFSRFLG